MSQTNLIRYLSRMRSGARFVLLLLLLLLLNACAPLKGFPSDPTDDQALKDQTLVASYYSPGQQNRQLLRDQIVSGRLDAYESSYSDFKRRLNGDNNTFNLSTDLGILVLAGVIATTGNISTAAALGAATAGIVGAKGAVNSDLYFQRTLPALLAQMDANRARAKLPILNGLRQSDSAYPLAIALSDLDALRDAGGIPTAIGGLTQQAEGGKAVAVAALSGFNTTNAGKCLQDLIDKPDPEGRANTVLIASKARALGVKLRFDFMVINWVTDPATNSTQLGVVARQVGCTAP